MSNNDSLILQAISDLSDRMETRFNSVDTKVDTKFDALDARIQKAERDIIRVKTVGGLVSMVATFVGWDHIKPWLTSLTR